MKMTKRKILSQVVRIYNPIGSAATFVVRAKIGLLELWQKGLDWDDEIPPAVQESLVSLFQEINDAGQCFLLKMFNSS